ncbi:SNF2 family N-terminal domain-containing protein [Apodospora peruviana]|uniref:SNF2 family N-terminal domain-containing protein n=1 Tax=Apodospora peruviana TaxID=516989 RepID=A0AAE0MF92_9PEZI|nr:SNF2 family N-terminal domain-containing protein [Apodospora peruviana]
MAFPSSPLPMRRSGGSILESPVPEKRGLRLLELDDSDDELSTVSDSPYFTQPTQIVDRPTIKPKSIVASSPRSVVEVPASSPFKQQPPARQGGRLANLMAPAGTAYNPPVRKAAPAPTSKGGGKRDFAIMISDDEFESPLYAGGDSSEDEKPNRGDIRPSSFARKESSIAVASKPPALKKSNNSKLDGSPMTSPVRPYIAQKDWISNLTSSPSSSSEAGAEPSPVKPPLPKPARRRLVQGRRPRQASPTSPVKPSPKAVPAPALVVNLISDDEDGDYEYNRVKEDTPDPLVSPSKGSPEEQEFNERVLNYLNNCDAVQLMAITNVKDEFAKAMLSHKPFSTLEAARTVSISQKKQTKGKRSAKSSRVAIGEEIVSAVKTYARALDGIDHVIAVCESQAEAIKRATSTWKLDLTGQPRNDVAKSDDGKPMTPMSMEDSTRLVDLPLGQPKYMDGNCVMKSFQIYGLNWLYLLYKNQYGGILADDMGLGKTCQVISLMCSIVEDFEQNGSDDSDRPWPNIVFVPPSTLANWGAEFKRFAPGLNVTVYQGSQAKRDEIAYEILDDPASHHVILTSYTQVSRPDDIANLRRLKPIVTVYDEGHKMKNPKTKLYKDLIRITSTWRLILSGTPVQNNLMEMVSLLQFVDPELFRDHFDDLEALFSQKVSLTAVSQGALLHSERVARARTILEPFILQRRKEQVLKDLPPKTTRVVHCEMEKTQKAIYKDYERRFKKTDMTETKGEKGRENDYNNVWIQLRKSAIHPQLFRRYFKDDTVREMANNLMKYVSQSELRQPNIEHLVNEIKALSDFEIHLWCRDYKCIRKYDIPDGSWMDAAKVQTLLGLIRQYQANGDRALVFTRFAKVIEILGECLASEGISYLSLQGNTDVADRQELINEFNADESIPVFLLTTGSGGTGINLTAANKVIIFDQSDNPQDDIQAENRAHRLGQTRPVEVIRLISKDTIEELVYKACQKKLELANKVTGYAIEMTQSEMEAAVRKEFMQNSTGSPPGSD